MKGDISPITLAAEEVKGILSKRKTSFRTSDGLAAVNGSPDDYEFSSVFKMRPDSLYTLYIFNESGRETYVQSPMSIEGDILWVREHWEDYLDAEQNKDFKDAYREKYLKKSGTKGWTTPHFMARAACRIFLKITNIRIERILDISKPDALKEGVESLDNENKLFKNYATPKKPFEFKDPRDSFKSLMKSIYGPLNINRNQWVFVFDFERIDPVQYAAENKKFAKWIAKAGHE